ncbi:hypothetical protein Pcinc_009957 [Petrolisthes cinctipes]|uniref:Uncharacterized protein n=1 Tax=Petrolisthes cinctipes TaxID=88211 RepID=A0AAE1GA02_PETCI|nr:hypothetical protein Pcinc_009957 [Petrolisthes cinctipes]
MGRGSEKVEKGRDNDNVGQCVSDLLQIDSRSSLSLFSTPPPSPLTWPTSSRLASLLITRLTTPPHTDHSPHHASTHRSLTSPRLHTHLNTHPHSPQHASTLTSPRLHTHTTHFTTPPHHPLHHASTPPTSPRLHTTHFTTPPHHPLHHASTPPTSPRLHTTHFNTTRFIRTHTHTHFTTPPHTHTTHLNTPPRQSPWSTLSPFPLSSSPPTSSII